MLKIGLTGATGFVGSHLKTRLETLGYKVKVSNANIDHEVPNFEGCDHIVHLAALTFVPDSWNDPIAFYRTNSIGTGNVLEAARKQNKSVTYISSYVYGNPEYLPIDEKHPTSPANPYMQSKLIAEDLCDFYRKNFNLKICVLRPFNLYGTGLADKFLIPTICQQVLDKNCPEVVLRSLHPKRDYVYISDLIEAIVQSIKKSNSETVNIASGESYSVLELTNMIMKIAGIEKKVISTDQHRPNEIMDTKADISKAKKVLDWVPRVSIKDGIKNIIKDLQSQ